MKTMKRTTTKTVLSCLASLPLLLAAAAGFGGHTASAHTGGDNPRLSPELDRVYKLLSEGALLTDLTVQANKALLGDPTPSVRAVADAAAATTTTVRKK